VRTLIGNLRYAVRMLRKNPGLTLAVVATAIYTVVYAIIIAPLPYPNADQLVIVWSKVSGHNNGTSAGDFLDWEQQSKSFQQLAAWNDRQLNLSTQDQPEQVQGRLASPGWFDMQGIPFLMGRDFLPEEGVPGKDHVVVLTNKLWNRLGANRNIIGQQLLVNGSPHTVIGVLAPGLGDRLGPELTLPLAFTPVGFVLLITCVNIANLLLAKGVMRQREVAIRGSMGASRRQIFAQFLTESLVLALVGGALGIALAQGLLRIILSIVPEGILPSEANFRLDFWVLVIAVAATTLAGLLFGCAPAWYASRVDPAESLKDGGRSSTGAGSQKLRRMLIMGEFALALSLLAGAGLAIHSFWNLTRVDVGVRTDHVLTFGLRQPHGRFESPAEMSTYNEQILSAVRSVAGVSDAAIVTGMPLRGTSDGMPFSVVGVPDSVDPALRPSAGFQSVSPGYFKTFGIQVVKGRSFTDHDTATSVRVAMVNEEFVRRYLKGMDPLQQRVSVEEIVPGQPKLGPPVEWQIVGVFHNVLYGDFRKAGPEIDVPYSQSLAPDVTIGARTTNDPGAMSKTIAAAVHSVDPQIALGHIRTMDQVKDESLAEDRFTVVLFASFAAAALLLAAIGIYGLMAFAVSQRTPEIGLRLALGSSKRRVVWLVLREASMLALFGLAIGFAGGLLVGRAMRTTLYGVDALDLSVIVLVAVILFFTALLASYLPARRAAAIDPMQALRTE
jgi:putative ABC transport system permease protein